MSDIEDNARSLTWWWEQLSLSEDWNSLTQGMRKDLLKKLQRVFIDIAEFHITQDEILSLIKLTDPPTVWDAMLSLRNFPKTGKSHWQVFAYLNKVVINTWRQQHPIVQPHWQPAPQPEKERKLASLETIEKWDSGNFKKRHCDGCGRLLRRDNETGLCRTCQRQRNG